jgi:K+-transporting ATPase KdpF subunit
MSGEPTWIYVLAGLLACALFAYLLYALVNAEHLE